MRANTLGANDVAVFVGFTVQNTVIVAQCDVCDEMAQLAFRGLNGDTHREYVIVEARSVECDAKRQVNAQVRLLPVEFKHARFEVVPHSRGDGLIVRVVKFAA